MPVLAKITPDYLRDTLVEVRYTAELPYDILKGLLYQKLIENYQLLSDISPLGIIKLGPQQQLKLGRSDVLDFTDKEIKIQVHEDRITFNSLNAYPGWKKYFPKIQAVLKTLQETGLILHFTRIGIRYISEFPKLLIFDHIRLDLRFAFLGDALPHNTTIRTELERETYKVVINLANNVQRRSPQEKDFFSIIDIDVIGDVPLNSGLKDLFKYIDKIHDLEKKTFQDILKPEFLSSLNPEFE